LRNQTSPAFPAFGDLADSDCNAANSGVALSLDPAAGGTLDLSGTQEGSTQSVV
jgi:hypothetical protein